MIGKYREARRRIILASEFEQVSQAVSIPSKAFCNLVVFFAVEMQEIIELRKIQKEEVRFFLEQILPGMKQDFRVAELMIRIGTVRHVLFREPVEDGPCASDAVGTVDGALLDPIEPRQQARTYAALEKRSQPEGMTAQFLESFTGVAIVQHAGGQKAKMTQPTERRTAGIVIKEIPMAASRRRFSGKDGWNRAAAEAEYRAERLPEGKQVLEKVLLFQASPSESVDKDKNMSAGLVPSCFHS